MRISYCSSDVCSSDLPLRGRTAVLLPVCNEDFRGVLGRLSIMGRSLAQVMGGERFEFFILSDSNAENGEIERTAYLKMRRGFSRPVHYRRRALNVGRKPGNIAELVERFGGAYAYMIVDRTSTRLNSSH